MLRSRRLKTAREKPHGLKDLVSACVCHLFVVLRHLGLFASQKSECLALAKRWTPVMGRVNKPYKGVGQGKFVEFISFWVPGATEHIESSVWGSIRGLSWWSALLNYVYVLTPMLENSAKPQNVKKCLTLLRALWVSWSTTVQTLMAPR